MLSKLSPFFRWVGGELSHITKCHLGLKIFIIGCSLYLRLIVNRFSEPNINAGSKEVLNLIYID